MRQETAWNHPTQGPPRRLTRFIGREVELAELKRLLQERRLVTLTGAGGSGKTRLAHELAITLAADFPDGIFIVELAPLSDPDLVLETVAHVLDVEAAGSPLLDVLSRFFLDRTSLLVLDNCEHLLDVCAGLADALLAACPNLCVLATSREPLGVGGECIFRVPLLSIPGPGFLSDPDKLLDFESVQLFLDRARLASPGFALTASTAESVAQVCIRLDGIPLALELAAASLRALTISELASRLDQRFKLLTSGDRTALPRQQTLKAMLDWSYALLTPVEEKVFRRLAVFPGYWSPDAAEYMCVDASPVPGSNLNIAPEDVLNALIHLVDKSLVQLDAASGRYWMLETIRLYALTLLEQAGELESVARRHLEWYLRFVEDGYPQKGTQNQQKWYLTLEAEQDNIRAALAWAILHEHIEEAARLCLALRSFWIDRVYYTEGLRWLEQVLALAERFPVEPSTQARLLSVAGVLLHSLNRFEEASAYHNKALLFWREQGDTAGVAASLLDMGWERFQAVDLETARRYAQESLLLARQSEDRRATASALNLFALASVEARYVDDTVLSAAEESLGLWRALGSLPDVAGGLAVLARAYQVRGDYGQVGSLLVESVRLQAGLGSHSGMIGCLSVMLFLARDALPPTERSVYVARVAGVFLALEGKMGGGTTGWTDMYISPLLEKLAVEMGAEALATELAIGKALNADEIVVMAEEMVRLMDAPASGPASVSRSSMPPPAAASESSTSVSAAGLTLREVEVLRLVAAGLTNQESAERLAVTPRTVNAHLTSIYSKIGVKSRSGAIRFALEHGLI